MSNCILFLIANKLLKEENYREASEYYSKALEVSPNIKVVPKLLYFRALAKSKLGFASIRDAINDCTRSMTDATLSKVLHLRGQCYLTLRNFRKSIEDFETLFKMEKSKDVENLLKEARLRLMRSQSKNYYDILEVKKSASQADIKKAYRNLALIHHPDKHSDDDKLEQQEIFKRISAANDVLSNQRKRAAYDEENLTD